YTKAAAQSNGDLTIDNNNQDSLGDTTFGRTPINETITFDTITIKNYGNLETGSSTNITYTTLDWSTKGTITDNGGTFDLLSGGGALLVPATSRLYAYTSRIHSSCTLNGWVETRQAITTAGDFNIGTVGTLTHEYNSTTQQYVIDITAANFNLSSGGTINVNARGYQHSAGPGQGINGQRAGGAGYGGDGGDGNVGAGGSAYGSITEPTDLGSGGGDYYPGGAGGGAVKLTIAGTTTIAGTISSNGGSGGGDAGGGSGGSVYITTGTLDGAGTITANGGNGEDTYAGGGGGGRIAVYYTTDNSSVTYWAYGGTPSGRYGGAGTIYKKPSSQTYGNLIVDNNSRSGDRTPLLTSDWTFNNVTIQNSGKLDANGHNITIHGNFTNSGGTFTHSSQTVTFADNTQVSHIYGSITFYNLTCTTAGKELQFEAGSTKTIADTLTLTGQSENLITLSSTAASAWNLVMNGTYDMDYITVSYSDASGGKTMYAANSIDGLNNTNWVFTGATITWDGSASTDWNTAANWDLNRQPIELDDVVIPLSGVTNEPTLSDVYTIGSLILASGRTLTCNSNLTVVNNVDVDATLDLNTTTFTVGGSIDFTNGTIQEDTSTILLNPSSGTKTLTTDTETLNNLTINDEGGGATLELQDTLTLSGNLTLTNGTLDTNDEALSINGNTTIAGGTLKTGTGIITFGDASGDTVTISSGALEIESDNTTTDIVKNAGTWTNSGGTITYNAATGVTTNLLSSLSSYYNLTLNSLGSTYTSDGAITAANDLTLTNGTLDTSTNNLTLTGNLLINGGTLNASNASCDLDIGGNVTVSSGTLSAPVALDDTSFTAAGNWEISGTGIFTHNSGRVLLDAPSSGKTITTSSSGTDDFYDVTLNNSSGSWTLQDELTINNDLYLTEGVLDANDQTLSINGNTTIDGGTLKTGTGVVTFGDTADDTVTISSGALEIESDNTTTDIVKNAGTWTNSGGTITYNAATVVTTNLLSSLSSYYNLTLNSSGSTYASDGAITVGNDLTLTNGTLNTSTNNLTLTGNLLINGGTLNASNASCDLDIGGNVTVSSGTLSAPAALDDTSFTAGGSWEISGTGIFTHNSGRILLDASSTGKTITTSSSGTDDFYDVKFNNSSGSWTLQDELTVNNDLYLTLGTLDMNDNNLTVTGDYTQSGGTLTCGSGTLRVDSNFTKSGGTFNENTGTVTFEGATNGTFNVATTETFNNVTINKTTDVSDALTITSGDTIVVTGTLNLTDGEVDTGTIEAQGDVTVGASFNHGNANTTFSGTNAQTITLTSDNFPTGTLTVNKSSGTATTSGTLTLAS
ncbi:MAG: hypothetical protein KAS59_05500, partial [Alphaproteobacteria bacterium]|nr:hypothetical protein [Alphaproteobacteria bacterium]